MDVAEACTCCDAVLAEVERAVIADRTFLETALLSVLARGHVPLKNVPGTGKTLTAGSIATALGLSFSRVQFTPDLLPSDVTGTHVFDERDRQDGESGERRRPECLSHRLRGGYDPTGNTYSPLGVTGRTPDTRRPVTSPRAPRGGSVRLPFLRPDRYRSEHVVSRGKTG